MQNRPWRRARRFALGLETASQKKKQKDKMKTDNMKLGSKKLFLNFTNVYTHTSS
jgi:hypothetical protein